MSLPASLDRVMLRAAELRAQLETAGGAEIGSISKELSGLEPLVEKVGEYRSLEVARDEAEAMLADPEMKELAEAELAEAKDRLPKLEREIRLMLLPRDEADARSAILEIRPAAGGDEAGLFAAELFTAYRKYAENHGWRFTTLDYDESELGGLKGASAEIEGKDVFARLKFESGVHRVQRVPATETQGRIHTSTITVAVLPEAEDVDVQIDDKDLRIDTYRAQGAGGQHVNKTSSAVRLIHEPTGLVASSQEERSQLQNREKAMTRLKAMIAAKIEEEHEEELARIAGRQAMVGWGSQIRSYVLQPYQMVKDLRTNLEDSNVEAVLDGNIDEFMEGYLRWRRSGADGSSS